ncbi:lipoyl(octanoyl) transferase [Angomonas deanei]|nr:lipoyl(octanoyl) transferase [Angomonas deanei]|eukprot:EPY28313.1 lipoyl(octanoyl) transferase [Angomonas deanei]
MKCFFLGRRGYKEVLAVQETLYKAKIERQSLIRRGETTQPALPDVTLMVEHAQPVYTLGRRDTSEGLPRDSTVEVVPTRRGGGITWHGPGQLTVYPIVHVQHLWQGAQQPPAKDRSPIVWYSAVLERTMMSIATAHGIPSHPYKTGVWAEEREGVPHRKLGSIGLQLGSWVSMHGTGLNVCNDLSYFDHIVMCELPGESATSLHQEMRERGMAGELPTIPEVAALFYREMAAHLRQDETSYAFDKMTDLSLEKEWEKAILQGTNITE